MDPEKLKVGDVITFRINETTRATHRIIEVTEMDGEVAFRTKGDANEHADNGLVPPSGIVGKVLFGIPGLGYLTVYIQNPPGIYIAISVAAFIMLLMVIPELIFNDRKSRENNKEEKL